MIVKVNGEVVDTLLESPSLNDLLAFLGDFDNRWKAVVVDGTVVPKAQYHHFLLSPGSIIEIVIPMQGG